MSLAIMRKQRDSTLRQCLAQEAARLMYEEEVPQYFTAKRLAAKRLLHRGGQHRHYLHPQDLPSNGEIQAALHILTQLQEGERSQRRLFAMRVIALETMRDLAPFQPRLIGSVSTGQVHYGSDIDLHVFTDGLEDLESYLCYLGWRFETARVTIRVANQLKDYTHIFWERVFPIELSVYSVAEMRVTHRSSTDGKPIVRLKPSALQALLAEQSPQAWECYLANGEIEGLEEFEQE